MVTLRHAPHYERKGPKLEPYQVILRPLISEKIRTITTGSW